ncbi:putative isomerase YddE [compost metagenome]
MTTVKVFHYDAFSSIPNQGNPAGVVFNADDLKESEMLDIAVKVGFNETVFIMKSTKADLRLRYFTPGHEINLCGHATMASLYGLKTRGLLGDKESIQIETNVGILPIQFYTNNHELSMRMKQDKPKFVPFHGDVDQLAASMGLKKKDLDLTIPIVYGSTGTWTLLVAIKELSKFKEMKPNNNMFPDVFVENPKSSIHPFCLDSYDKKSLMHARHFSSPYSGTIEDPVTGTASGVMGAYYLTYMKPDLTSVEFSVEQGQEIGRDGTVYVNAIRNEEHMDIYISGTAVFVQEFEVSL